MSELLHLNSFECSSIFLFFLCDSSGAVTWMFVVLVYNRFGILTC